MPRSANIRHSSDQQLDAFKASMVDWVRGAGKILLRSFGRITHPRRKEAASSIVCDADLASEKYVLQQIRTRFPEHNIISEECGAVWQSSDYTWVIDPLDGTSNFVAGVPWFGVQMGVLQRGVPIMAAMYLPIDDVLYFAQAGQGASRNGRKVRVLAEPDLGNVLCAFGFDPGPARSDQWRVELLFRVAREVRNTRTTNSLVDFCYTIDGRFGACINLKTKIWDIVPVSVILPEAGGKFTDLKGRPIAFELDDRSTERDYAVLAANLQLHKQLARLTGDISGS